MKKAAKAASPRKAAAKSAAKPAVKAVARKSVAKTVAAKKVAAKKAVVKKAVAKKAVVGQGAPKKAEVKKAPAPVKAAKPAVKPTAPVAPPAPPKPSTRKAEVPGKFVTTSKPDSDIATKGAKARATPPVLPADNGVTMQDGRYTLPASVHIDLPDGYKPKADEEYMSPQQLQYFRNKLSKWREDLVEESRQTIESLRDEVRDVGDEAERATRETENSLELRTRDRYRKLIAKIDKALKRIEEGRYGFCEETDEEIGIDRLEARPIATLSLDAQERWEHRQKLMGD
ncbi:RNA polymerase-binding protein DksA [Dokdonella sp.]|uniref:RNA polymerase-binding protein DksA n=1 Tax=Dokdonella sp. TaxID=2291710 RepID=UPI0031F32595